VQQQSWPFRVSPERYVPEGAYSEHKEDAMKKDLLVTLADKNYIDQAKQLFSSVYWNAGWKGDYMLLTYDIPEKHLTWFRDKGIGIRKCEAILTESETPIGHAPLTTLSKFYLFTPEFRKWENIVFLDGDIVVRGSLDALTEVKGFAAARILNIFRTRLKGQFRKRTKENGNLFDELESRYDLNRPAFNAGMMAFNSDMISEDDFGNLKSILFHFRDIINISEETVLNMHFYGRWQALSQVYNICPNYEIYLSGCIPDELKGVVCHTYSNFPGRKPWIQCSPLNREWKANLDKADMMDEARPQPPRKKLNSKEEARYDVYLKNLHRIHFYGFYLYIIRYFYRYKYGPLADAFLKNHYPKIYKLQRKLRNMK
jgi:lipopolysaccharide biosynthesis glycosyltransferase